MFSSGTLDFRTIQTAVIARERLKTFQCRIKEPYTAAKRSALEMVIRGSDLNQSLQKLLEI